MILATALLFLASSCKKEETQNVERVTEEEALEVMEMSVETESMGISEQIEEVAIITTESLLANPLCGNTFDTTIIKQYSNTSTSVDYTFNWHKVTNCTDNTISDFTYTYTASGSYNSQRMSSSSTANGTLIISQLSPSFDDYLADVSYTKIGTHESKIGNNNSFTSTVIVNSPDVLIDKSTLRISSGTMNITLSGSTSAGTTFSFNGVIVFLGNGEASITLSNGNVYNVSL